MLITPPAHTLALLRFDIQLMFHALRDVTPRLAYCRHYNIFMKLVASSSLSFRYCRRHADADSVPRVIAYAMPRRCGYRYGARHAAAAYAADADTATRSLRCLPPPYFAYDAGFIYVIMLLCFRWLMMFFCHTTLPLMLTPRCRRYIILFFSPLDADAALRRCYAAAMMMMLS